MDVQLPAAWILGILPVLAGGCLILGSVRDVECEVRDATGTPINLSANATSASPRYSVAVQFACTNTGWIPLANGTAEVRVAEKGREIGEGWYTAGDLVAVQQVPLGTLEPGIPVIRGARFRALNWTRDVGIHVRPYQS